MRKGESGDYLASCMQMTWFYVVNQRGLKVIADKRKVMVMNEEEGLECEDHMDGILLKHVLNSNIWDVFWTNQVHMGQSVVGRW